MNKYSQEYCFELYNHDLINSCHEITKKLSITLFLMSFLRIRWHDIQSNFKKDNLNNLLNLYLFEYTASKLYENFVSFHKAYKNDKSCQNKAFYKNALNPLENIMEESKNNSNFGIKYKFIMINNSNTEKILYEKNNKKKEIFNDLLAKHIKNQEVEFDKKIKEFFLV